MAPITVLICDEFSIIRNGLQTFLEASQGIEVVGVSDSAMSALMLIRQHRPDVVISGLKYRGMSGVELIRRVVAEKDASGAGARCIAFSMDWDDDAISEVLRAGVDGVLIGDSKREEVEYAVRTVAAGGTALCSEVAGRLIDWFRSRDLHPGTDESPAISTLTAREREVLSLVGQGMAIEEVAEELSIRVSTIRTHLHRLRNKLCLRDRAQLVSYAYRSGLVKQSA
ncbi:response regulator [Streptomyces achromogenes]|uniref:response regulator n=1 Tax=Streptomyces achromogenes TaxID=67255 RepID=UPI00056D9526|nr:response regulator transcription factor [Streptomyces achromogenes]